VRRRKRVRMRPPRKPIAIAVDSRRERLRRAQLAMREWHVNDDRERLAKHLADEVRRLTPNAVVVDDRSRALERDNE